MRGRIQSAIHAGPWNQYERDCCDVEIPYKYYQYYSIATYAVYVNHGVLRHERLCGSSSVVACWLVLYVVDYEYRYWK